MIHAFVIRWPDDVNRPLSQARSPCDQLYDLQRAYCRPHTWAWNHVGEVHVSALGGTMDEAGAWRRERRRFPGTGEAYRSRK